MLGDFRIPKSPWVWSFLLLVTLAPFLFRTGLDLGVLQKQSVLRVYRDFVFSPAAEGIERKSAVVFVRADEKSLAEEEFVVQLRKDFRVEDDIGQELPRIRAVFDVDSIFSGRVEVEHPSGDVKVFESRHRMVNNGILLGALISLVVWLLSGQRLFALGVGVLALGFWFSAWNPIQIPVVFAQALFGLSWELLARAQSSNWTASELGRLGELSAVIYAVAILPLGILLWRIAQHWIRGYKTSLVLLVLLEPLAIFLASRFAQWDVGQTWWKVYLGSWVYRYGFVATMALLYFKTKHSRLSLAQIGNSRNVLPAWAVSLAAVAWVLAGAWDWLSATLVVGSSESLWLLKALVVGAAASFVTGSRVLSLWLCLLVTALSSPPELGHWVAAKHMAYLLDGLWLGWWLSPHRVREIPSVDPRPWGLTWGFLVIAYICGHFLSSVGSPAAISWLAALLGFWAFAQLWPRAEARPLSELKSQI